MKGNSRLLIVIALLTFNLQYAQDNDGDKENLSLDEGPISGQFDYIFKKSGNYQEYEVVKKTNLLKLRDNVLDSLSASTKKEAELNNTITKHESTIASLNNKLEETTNNLASVTEEKDSMSFLGVMVAKVTYNLILWTIIAALLLLLLLFIYKFRRSNILTQEAKGNLSEVEIEYEEHRRKALEREQKISRRLQDEINKYKKTK